MAKYSETTMRIADRLVGQFELHACEYEPIGAAAIDDLAAELGKDFKGLVDLYTKMTKSAREEYADRLGARSAR